MDISFDDTESILSKIMQWFKRLQFGNRAQLAFLEDFYTLVNDGIPANRAIEMMSEMTTGISKEVATSISQKISEGQPLATGMQNWFAMNVVEVIRVGEEGGALNETLKSAITALQQRGGAFGAVISAILYPLMVITMACAVIVYLNTTVFVQFRAIKPIEQWPPAGQQLVHVAILIQEWWWLLLALIIGFIFLLRFIMHNYTGGLRTALDKIPPFSIYRQFVASRVMETLGLLVANGVVFKQALKVMQYQSNPYLASHLVMMEHLIGTGKGNIADVLNTGLINDKDIMRLRVMAEVKGFEHGLVRMGVHGAEANTRTIKLIAKIVGGILLTVGAMLILLIVRGIYMTGMAMGG